jgi:hypothetical protein
MKEGCGQLLWLEESAIPRTRSAPDYHVTYCPLIRLDRSLGLTRKIEGVLPQD